MTASSSKILIIGGGPVGLAAALALRAEAASDDITVLEAAPRDKQSFGDRNIALSLASWRFLESLGVNIATTLRAPIREVEVSQSGAFGLLRLRASDVGETMLGAATPYPALKTALDDAVEKAGINVMYGARAQSIEQHAPPIIVRLESGEELHADAVALSDGAGSGADLMPKFRRFERASGQIALLTRVKVQRPQAGVAYERFTAGGALALIPRADGEHTVIWARPAAEAERQLALNAELFSDELNAAFGDTLGALQVTAVRSSYPLSWRIVEPRVSGAVVALGNAAQGLHPVAAQGLNLGLRDAAEWATDVARQTQHGTAKDALNFSPFARSRALDRLGSIGFSGALAYGFDRGGWLLDLPRGLGLAAADLLPPLKRAFIRRMAL